MNIHRNDDLLGVLTQIAFLTFLCVESDMNKKIQYNSRKNRVMDMPILKLNIFRWFSSGDMH